MSDNVLNMSCTAGPARSSNIALFCVSSVIPLAVTYVWNLDGSQIYTSRHDLSKLNTETLSKIHLIFTANVL